MTAGDKVIVDKGSAGYNAQLISHTENFATISVGDAEWEVLRSRVSIV